MRRPLLLAGALVGIAFAACSSDDSGNEDQQTNVEGNQPGDEGMGAEPGGESTPDDSSSGDTANSSGNDPLDDAPVDAPARSEPVTAPGAHT